MPIQLRWDDDRHQTLIFSFEGVWTMDDYYKMVADTYAMITGEAHRVVDFTKAANMIPRGFLPALQTSDAKVPSNIGLLISVKTHAVVQILARVAKSVGVKSMQNIYFVNTLDKARALIARHEAEKRT